MVTVVSSSSKRGAGVLEIEALRELAARLIDRIGQLVGIDLGYYVEGGHAAQRYPRACRVKSLA